MNAYHFWDSPLKNGDKGGCFPLLLKYSDHELPVRGYSKTYPSQSLDGEGWDGGDYRLLCRVQLSCVPV